MLNFPNNPTIGDYVNFGQIHFSWDGTKWRSMIDNVPDVILHDVPTSAIEGTTLTITIYNYDSTLSYYVDASKGSISRTDDIITWVLPELYFTESVDLLVQATRVKTQTTATTAMPITVEVIDVIEADNNFIVTSFGNSSYNDLWST